MAAWLLTVDRCGCHSNASTCGRATLTRCRMTTCRFNLPLPQCLVPHFSVPQFWFTAKWPLFS